MRSRYRCGLGVMVGILLAGSGLPAAAAEVGLGLRAGTYGYGAELGIRVNSWFAVRGSFYTGTLSDTYTETDLTYDGDLDLGGGGILADFYPSRGKFRLSAGVYSNRNEATLRGTATEDQTIGNNVYTPAEIGVLEGLLEFDDTAPYFGIGWGRLAGGNRVGFLFDAGVVKQGSGELTLTSSGAVSALDLALEIEDIEEDIEDYEFWPVISFGLAIRF